MAETAPIIVKRIKKYAAGHHGGSWKVAYADFVTAMMAFFLLLWLLNVTSPDQKKGIADYFTPTIGIKDGKGIGFKGGLRAASRGISKNDLTAPGMVAGQVQQGPVAKDPDDAKHPDPDSEAAATGSKDKPGGADSVHKQDSEDSEQFKIAGEEVKQAMSDDPDLRQYRNNVEVHDTPEGLKIELVDDEKQSMFIAGGAQLSEQGKKVLDSMVNIVSKTPNEIMIIGHTDAAKPGDTAKYSIWELSADRANAARRELSTTQLEPERVARIVGMADKDLLVPAEPANPRNRRVSILLMRGAYFNASKGNIAAKAMLSLPDAKVKKVQSPAESVALPVTPEESPAEKMKNMLLPDKKKEEKKPATPANGKRIDPSIYAPKETANEEP